VGEHARAGVEQPGAVIADGNAAGNLLPVQLAGRVLEVRDELLVGGRAGGIAHPLDRPGQVDGGGAGGGQAVAGLVEVVASLTGGDGGAVGGGHADRGCAAHDHGADRVDHLGPVVVAVLAALARQQRLVEQHQAAVLDPDDRVRRKR
jgi:hypothetical protein